jgi:plasmid stabilization system protein ParE
MACKLIWSPAARDDLHDIVRFIARDNRERAESFGYELMMRTDILHENPEAGRICFRVSESPNPRNYLSTVSYRLSPRYGATIGRDCACLARSTGRSVSLNLFGRWSASP